MPPRVASTAQSLEALINRISILSGVELAQAAQELERVAQNPKLFLLMNERLLTYLCEALVDSSPDCVLKSVCLVVANACVTTDDLANSHTLVKANIGGRVAALLRCKGSSAPVVFSALDVVATLCAASGEARAHFQPLIGDVLAVMRLHKANLEILFASVCTLSTLTLADAAAVVRLAQEGGLQVLIEVFKYAARRRQLRNASSSSATDDESSAVLLKDVMRWSKQALLNCARCSEPQLKQYFDSTKWDSFGQVVEVDELKMALTFERRRGTASLESGPGSREKANAAK